ncbi:MAG: accessory factor UbiK family protein [Betaproteobacteria bacterium]|nr:MAG: accessory factor UbiK family protein [Betaproteobacteria bacterium]
MANTPVEDVQKNLRALLSSWFARLDLVTREEFDVQQAVLQRTREKLLQMETRVAELERSLTDNNEN